MSELTRFLLTTVLPLSLLAVSVAVMIGSLEWHRWRKHSDRVSALTRNLLRPPGHYLQQRADELTLDIMGYLVYAMVFPLLLYGMLISSFYVGDMVPGWLSIGAFVVSGLAVQLYLIRGVHHAWTQRRYVLLGLDGERAVAEELNQLMFGGARVYHDVPFDYGNIDHVVISHSGVFAVETKMLGKLRDGEAPNEVIVDYERGVLKFPDRDVKIPADQANTSARWLATFLGSSTGLPVDVEPIITLPGWFIKERIGGGRPLVISPAKPQRFFLHENRETLSRERVQQIAHQVEQLCRNVEPIAKRR